MSNETRRKSHAPTVLLTLVGAFVIYVLSIGPVEYFLVNHMIPSSYSHLVNKFYTPVFKLATLMSLQDPLYVYLRWWFDLAPISDPFESLMSRSHDWN